MTRPPSHPFGPQGPIWEHLPLSNFATVVHSALLVSMDLEVLRNGTEVLLGHRNNRLAQDYWFVHRQREHGGNGAQTSTLGAGDHQLNLLWRAGGI